MRRAVVIVATCLLILLGLLATLAALGLGGGSLPADLLAPGATGLVVRGNGWSLTEASYQVPADYRQVRYDLRTQMAANGWTSLRATPTLGPSIFNPDPAPLLFQRSYWLGWMYETASVRCTVGPPSRVEVAVTRTIRWPPWLKQLVLR